MNYLLARLKNTFLTFPEMKMITNEQGSNNNTGDTGQVYLVLFLLFTGGLFLMSMVLPKLNYPGSLITRVIVYFGLAIIDTVLGVFTYEIYKSCQRTKREQIIRN